MASIAEIRKVAAPCRAACELLRRKLPSWIDRNMAWTAIDRAHWILLELSEYQSAKPGNLDEESSLLETANFVWGSLVELDEILPACDFYTRPVDVTDSLERLKEFAMEIIMEEDEQMREEMREERVRVQMEKGASVWAKAGDME